MKATLVRKGSVIVYNNAPYKIMEFRHNTPGNLTANIKVKMRNLINGSQTEQKFQASEDIQEADVYSFKATYLYNDGEGYHFMNSDSYEEVLLSADLLGDSVYYVQDQMQVSITTYNDEPIGIEVPTSVTLTVVETEPELKGATASNSPKPAKTDTGLLLTVPAFVKEGDKIIVNTEEGVYMSRGE